MVNRSNNTRINNDAIPVTNEVRIQNSDGLNMFTIFFMMIIFKGMLISIAGPTPGYDMQRILASKTPKEAALMSGIVSICQIPRWFMIVGVTTLALVFFSNDLIEMGDKVDFELVLPWVISEFLPANSEMSAPATNECGFARLPSGGAFGSEPVNTTTRTSSLLDAHSHAFFIAS